MHNEVKDIEREMRSRTVGYISAAFGLVAGLAWNEAIAAAIDSLFPLSKDTVPVKFLYAAVVTVAVVVLVRYLDRMVNKKDEKKNP